MPIPSNAVASIKGASTIEALFAALTAQLQPRKILAGGYDPAETAIVDDTGYTILSAAQAADLFGFGSQIHRMAIYHFKATGGAIPTTAFALPAAAGGVEAEYTITFATNTTTAGTYIFRLGSYLTEDVISIGVASGATPDEVAALLNAAIAEKPNLPFTATVALGVVTLVAKTADINTDDFQVTVNQKADEADLQPASMTVVIANSVAGVGKSDLSGLWAYMGAETSPWNTGVVTPYGDTLELDAGSAAIGNPNDQTGLYDALDYRPATVYTTDTDPGEAGLTAAIAIGDGRKLDAGNCRIEAPDYPEIGYEIAAYVSGFLDLAALNRSASAYTRLTMPELYGPLDPADDWTTVAPAGTKAYTNRDAAVKAGLFPIIYTDGVARPGDAACFWHPDDNQNAPFKFQVNRVKAWNIQNIVNIYLNGDDLADRPIVNSVAAVKQSQKAIDVDTVKAGLAQVAGAAESEAWIYDGEFTIKNTVVTESSVNPDRFDITFPVILSGNNRVNSGEIQIDRNLQAITLNLVA